VQMSSKTVFAALIILLLFSTKISAQKDLLFQMRKKYLLEQKNGNCLLCHERSHDGQILDHKFNLFGVDLLAEPAMAPLRSKKIDEKLTPAERNAFDSVLVKLEQTDSDRDGATNLEELVLGTFPGDPQSTPAPEALKRYQNYVRRNEEPAEPPRVIVDAPPKPSRSPVSSLTQLLIIMVVMIVGVWLMLRRRQRD
jgi:hypothetical protein